MLQAEEYIAVSRILRCSCACLWLLVANLTLSAGAAARAAEPPKPVAVVSVASVDHVLNDLSYLSKLSGRPEVDGIVRMAGASFLQHFDRSKPLGLLITIEQDEPKGVAFLPVADLDKALTVVRDRFGATVDVLGNDVKKLALGKGVYLKQQGPWLFVSDQAQHLNNLPADPVAMLDGLEKQYSLAMRFYVQNVPSSLRDLVAFQLHSQLDADLKQAEFDDPEIDGPFMRSAHQELKKSIHVLLSESDQLTIGWAVDSHNGRVVADLQATAVAGSSLAQQLPGFAPGRSTFAGFIVDDAAATIQGVVRISPEIGQRMEGLISYVRAKAIKGIERDPAAPQALKDVVNGVLDIVDRTVKEGATEMAASVVLAPQSFRFVAGVHVADGRAMAEAFEKLYDLAKQQPDVPQVEFFADKHRDVDLHTMTIPISERDAEARRTLGDHLDVVMGTGPQSVYFALGDKGDELLRTAIDQSAQASETTVPPVHVRVAAKPLVAFLASLEGADDKPAKMAEILSQTRGGDSVQLTVSPLENGLTCRLQVDEAVLELLGKTAQAQKKRP